MRRLGALVVLAAVAAAQDKRLKPEQTANKVLAAFEAKNVAALKALAEKDNPDPWLVADLLCAQGKHDAAMAFAKAAPRKDVEKLPGYVASRRGKPANAAAHAAVLAANMAMSARDPDGIFKALAGVELDRATVVASRLLCCRAMGHSQRKDRDKSIVALRDAGAVALELGWLTRASFALSQVGVRYYLKGDMARARAADEQVLRIEEQLVRPEPFFVADALNRLARIHRDAREFAAARRCYEKALPIIRRTGKPRDVVVAFRAIGMTLLNEGKPAKALAVQKHALRVAGGLDIPKLKGTVLNDMGGSLSRLGRFRDALEVYRRALAHSEKARAASGIAVALGNIGLTQWYLGDYKEALEYQERSLKLKQELGDRAGVALTLGNIGLVHESRSAYAKALEYQERALKLKQELGDRPGTAATLENIGIIHFGRGAYATALEYYERSRKLEEELGDRAGAAGSLINIGNVHLARGAYAAALEFYERGLAQAESIGHRALTASALGNIGSIHWSLGAYTKALGYHERSLKIMEELGDRAGVAAALANIGAIHAQCDASAKALAYQERTLQLMKELGDRAGVAIALANIGRTHERFGAYAKALEYQERALRLSKELGARAKVASVLVSIAQLHRRLGAHARALAHHERGLALAAELGVLDSEVRHLWGRAETHIVLGNPAEAARAARRGVEKLPALVGRLAEGQGATARDRWTGLLDHGVRAGMQLDDPGEVLYFLESGRAGALLESLGSRRALKEVAIPGKLREEEIAARSAILEAQARHGSALKGRRRNEIRAARAALDDARGKMLEVVAKIQRAAKAAADVVYPEAADLEEIRSNLGADEALVLYALVSQDAMALVVTANNARNVALGKTARIEALLGKLALENPKEDPSAGLRLLRRMLVDPLGLDSTTKRVLVSPHKTLAYLPFALLLDGREVTYVPSGTTYGVLRAERTKRGEGVLALGDPDYGTKVAKQALLVLHRGGKLTRLPGTREEAKSVGDVVLLGTDATESGLRETLQKRERWRAVHLACHGLVDPERPLLSSLALSPGAGEDGFLTTLEVFSMKIPADLVVLSACETGKGKVYASEGIVGFTRAFMFAGAPRVIVSLWKVDDLATRALMTKFYELWKPGKTSTAAALKKAQEFVRGHEKWKHPYFWAAWQLWGLGD